MSNVNESKLQVNARTYVYIDGFTLYYGCLKGTPYKWLDLLALCRVMLPNDALDQIKYFTANRTR